MSKLAEHKHLYTFSGINIGKLGPFSDLEITGILLNRYMYVTSFFEKEEGQQEKKLTSQLSGNF